MTPAARTTAERSGTAERRIKAAPRGWAASLVLRAAEGRWLRPEVEQVVALSWKEEPETDRRTTAAALADSRAPVSPMAYGKRRLWQRRSGCRAPDDGSGALSAQREETHPVRNEAV